MSNGTAVARRSAARTFTAGDRISNVPELMALRARLDARQAKLPATPEGLAEAVRMGYMFHGVNDVTAAALDGGTFDAERGQALVAKFLTYTGWLRDLELAEDGLMGLVDAVRLVPDSSDPEETVDLVASAAGMTSRHGSADDVQEMRDWLAGFYAAVAVAPDFSPAAMADAGCL